MKHKLVGLVAVTGLAVAGCGGSSSNGSLSYSAFSQAADKICKDTYAAIAPLRTLHATSASQLVDPLNKEYGVLQSAITRFKALQSPSTLNAARDAVVSDLQQLSSEVKEMSSAAKSNNISQLGSAENSIKAQKGQRRADINKLGAPACVHVNRT